MEERDYAGYNAHLQRKYGWLYPVGAIAAIGVGYGVGVATSLMVGVAATLAMLVAGDYAWGRIGRRMMIKRFPELRDWRQWSYEGWLVKYRARRFTDRCSEHHD
jgi:hypothetical protein